ncbi:MAG: hypothetical protein KDJ35_07670 [Alphaproteobacteria bacterium]|nr:hypothetical protein [Alphaproteobacteria bacterium]
MKAEQTRQEIRVIVPPARLGDHIKALQTEFPGSDADAKFSFGGKPTGTIIRFFAAAADLDGLQERIEKATGYKMAKTDEYNFTVST